MVNAAFTKPAIMYLPSSTAGTDLSCKFTRLASCSPPAPLLMARSYPPGASGNCHMRPDDLAVVAELVDAQR